MNWFEKMKTGLKTRIKREVPGGIWSKCTQCGHTTYHHALERHGWICPECGFHFPIEHRHYADLLIDDDSLVELDPGITAADPLRFKDHKRYSDRIKAARKESNLNESIFTAVGRIGGYPVALGIMDTRFIMGSLGGATGEKITRLIDRAIADRRTLIIVCQSAGARMMESAFSLMQMAKTSARLHQLAHAGLLYISVLTDPTYGGVTASFGMLGDIILAEPGARIGFAGQRVIKQFLGTDTLPEGFQLAETVREHGFVDRIVRRDELAPTLTRLIALLAPAEEAVAHGAGTLSPTPDG